jgi:hypothetical protein
MPGAGEGRWPGKASLPLGMMLHLLQGPGPLQFRVPPHLTILRLRHERRMIHRRNTLKVGSPEGEAAVAGAAPGTVAKGPSLVVAIQRQAGMALGDEREDLSPFQAGAGPEAASRVPSARRF